MTIFTWRMPWPNPDLPFRLTHAVSDLPDTYRGTIAKTFCKRSILEAECVMKPAAEVDCPTCQVEYAAYLLARESDLE